jgi:hypothetical protein
MASAHLWGVKTLTTWNAELASHTAPHIQPPLCARSQPIERRVRRPPPRRHQAGDVDERRSPQPRGRGPDSLPFCRQPWRSSPARTLQRTGDVSVAWLFRMLAFVNFPQHSSACFRRQTRIIHGSRLPKGHRGMPVFPTKSDRLLFAAPTVPTPVPVSRHSSPPRVSELNGWPGDRPFVSSHHMD